METCINMDLPVITPATSILTPAMEWSREMNLRLIDELKLRRSLWDVNSSEYRDKHQKKKDYEEVAAMLSVTCAEIGKRIHNLKSQFRREYRRSKLCYPPYKSKWYGFHPLRFLKQNDLTFQGSGNNSDEWEDDESCSVKETAPTDQPSSTVFVPSIPTTEPDEDQIKSISFTSYVPKNPYKKHKFAGNKEIIRPQRDESTIFGEYVTHELRKIPNQYVLTVTKHRIQEVLFNAHMCMYVPLDASVPKDFEDLWKCISGYSKDSDTASQNSGKME